MRRAVAALTKSILLAMVLASVAGPGLAQSSKPSQVLKDLLDRQEKLEEKFAEAVDKGEANPYELDARLGEIREQAGRLAAGFQLEGWKNSELLALAELHQIAEQYREAANVYRTVRRLNPSAPRVEGLDIEGSLIAVLLQGDQIDEAGALLAREFPVRLRDIFIPMARVELIKSLAYILRDEQRLEQAAERAWTGYNLADQLGKLRTIGKSMRESVQRIQLSLAALYIATAERLNRQKESENMRRLVAKYDFQSNPVIKTYFEEELKRERLIGRYAPELQIVQWIGGRPLPLDTWAGKVVVLDFWAMWCEPCQAAFPAWRDLHAKYGEQGLRLIGVTKWYGRSDRNEDLSRDEEFKQLQAYREKHKLTYSIAVGAMDDVVNEERYEVTGIPTVVVIDRQGRIRYIKRGIGDYRRFEKQLRKLLAESSL